MRLAGVLGGDVLRYAAGNHSAAVIAAFGAHVDEPVL